MTSYYQILVKTRILLILLSIYLLTGCKNDSNKNMPHRGKIDIQIKNILIDSIVIDAANTSLVGSFFLQDSLIAFSDQMYASLFLYKLNGEMIGRFLGQGKGPNELPKLRKIVPIEDSQEYIALIGTNSYSIINKNNWTTKTKYIDWGWENNYKSTSSNNISNYSINLRNPVSLDIKPIADSLFIFPIIATSKNFAGFSPESNAEKFYKEGRPLGVLNRNTGNIDKLIGQYPPIYLNYEYIPNFTTFSFDVNIDTIFMSFNPDSLISVFKYPDKNICTFGYKGRDMDQTYRETNTMDEAFKGLKEDVQKYGYYMTLKYFKNSKLLFRGYYKGDQAKTDGLQIYHNYDLIGDVDVPKRFQLLGCFNNVYYGVKYFPDIYEQKFVFYKFSI